MARKLSKTWNQPPFPPLVWDGGFWTGSVVLKSWEGFQARGGPYGSVSSTSAATGAAKLSVNPVGGDYAHPSDEQALGFRFLLECEDQVHDAVLQAIFDAYSSLQEAYAYDEDEAQEIMPDISRPQQLRELIGLSIIHILPVSKEGAAYVGFELGCMWDEEHGLGIMTHQGRIVEVGGADTSFLEWVAEKDARPRESKAADATSINE